MLFSLFLFLYISLSLLSINGVIEIKLMQADEMKNVLHAKLVSYQKRPGAWRKGTRDC